MRRLCVIGAVLVAPLVAHAEPDSCSTALTFVSGRSALAPPTKRAIEPTLKTLRTHPELHVQIVAAKGHDAALAKKRGEVVKWFLVDGGIEVDRIAVSVGAVADGQLSLQVAGCTASLTQTVASRLAPVHPAVDEHPAAGVHPAAGEHPAAALDGSLVDDASDFANLLAGDPVDRAPAATPTGPAGPLVVSRAPTLTIGNDSVGFRGDYSVHANTAVGGLRLASATLVDTAPQHQESVTRTTLSTGPALGALQPAGQPVKLDGRQLRALSRCYRKVPGLHPGDKGDVELAFVVDRVGRVKQPVVITDDDELIGCIGNVMKTWEFSTLKKKRSQIWLSVVLTAG